MGENYTLTHGWTYNGNLRAVTIFYLPNGLSSKENQFAEKDQSVAKRGAKSRHKETTPEVLGWVPLLRFSLIPALGSRHIFLSFHIVSFLSSANIGYFLLYVVRNF